MSTVSSNQLVEVACFLRNASSHVVHGFSFDQSPNQFNGWSCAAISIRPVLQKQANASLLLSTRWYLLHSSGWSRKCLANLIVSGRGIASTVWLESLWRKENTFSDGAQLYFTILGAFSPQSFFSVVFLMVEVPTTLFSKFPVSFPPKCITSQSFSPI